MNLDNFFFYPDDIDYGGYPHKSGFEYEDVRFKSSDNIILHGWFIPSTSLEEPQGTIIHFHGNAANMTNHWHLVEWIPRTRYNLFTFDYRGFGQSEGTPNLNGVFEDCMAAISFVRFYKPHNSKDIVFLGQSIGGAFSLISAKKAINTKQDIKGIITDSSFASFRSVVNAKMSMLPKVIRGGLVNTLVNEKYSSKGKIDELTMPKLFIHGTDDEVVPYKCGQELFQTAPKPKQFLKINNGKHLSVFNKKSKADMSLVMRFLDSLSCK
ncbi:hypothetical protein MNBD_CHLOROFLEXI01-1334 [hydrothermal vent metagenome]|uniref:AB hydrolase-1 domain-containing protein n=1 Tax=hydrothermal vent metagenome TaxID=652676 RepID=A0A3B0VEY2_9ZZZZ